MVIMIRRSCCDQTRLKSLRKLVANAIFREIFQNEKKKKKKKTIFLIIFIILKQRFWVHVRTASPRRF